jgi:hypothetical protein
MDAIQFAYWLQGFAEIHGGAPTPAQWEVIKDHLNLVFNKVTPNRNVAPNQPFAPYPPFPGNHYDPTPSIIPSPYTEGPICGGEPIWRVPAPGEPGEVTYCAPVPQTTTNSRNICCGGDCGCPTGEPGVPPYVEGYPVNIQGSIYATGVDPAARPDYAQGGYVPGVDPAAAKLNYLSPSIQNAIYDEILKQTRAGGVLYTPKLSSVPPPITC